MSYEKDSKSRIVVLDIETVSETDDPKGCFNAMTGRIVSIAMVIDNGFELRPVVICDQDETKILEAFWSNLTREDYIVGHNCLDFDIRYLKQRSWIKNVKPTVDISQRKYWLDDVFDIMCVWSNWGYKNELKGCGLDDIAKALGLAGKTGHGSEVAGLWAAKEYVKLMDYNLADSLLSYQIYCRMTYRQPLALRVPQGFPAFMPGDTRELVPVQQSFQQKGPEMFQASQAQLKAEPPANTNPAPSVPHTSTPTVRTVPAAATLAAPPRRRRSARAKEIQYAEMGGALILGGATFPIKDSLSDMGGRWDGKVWQVPAAKLGAVQAACAESGIRLIGGA